MNTRIVGVAGMVALSLVVLATGAFVYTFGWVPIKSQERWGQFGDFFGGFLNPLFAMLAFLALLWSIALQAREFQQASTYLSVQADVARQELQQMRDSRVNEELLHVVKDIDIRLANLLVHEISPPGTYPRLTIAHMVSEAERVATSGAQSAAYDEFIVQARTAGSMVEAPVREIIYLIEKMRDFLQQYSHIKSGAYAPVIVYYADKVFHLLHMVEHIGGLPDDTRTFFATISDGHE